MKTAIGLMSGTSLDGVDVALIRTNGERVESFGATGYRPYSDAERNLLRQALQDAVGMTDRLARPGVLAEAEEVVTQAHAQAVTAFLADHVIDPADVEIIGFHGQTVLHRPAERLTVQIGDGAALAAMVNMPVMFDFRAADIAQGGQGAPLVPVYHRALVQDLEHAGPVVVVNIGGVSNITYVDGQDTLIACDTGPGNALLDDLMLRVHGLPYDDGGMVAATGVIDERWLEAALADPFFKLPPPKSLDRNSFASLPVDDLKPGTGAATLTAFTAASIAAITEHLPKPAERWVVAGGGARNRTLVRMLREQLGPSVSVKTADVYGWSTDAMEAQAFAFLAVRAQRGLSLTYPGTTGVPAEVTGGVYVPA